MKQVNFDNHPARIKIKDLESEVANLKNALAQKDNEINVLKNTVAGTNSNLSQKDSEINSLKSTISSSALALSQKDNEISQLKKEITPSKEKLAEYKRLADEKTGMVDLLKASLEELKIDKTELRADKLALAKENEQLKKQLSDFSIVYEENPSNIHNTNTVLNIMGYSVHTVESEVLNNEVSLGGSNGMSNFSVLDES